MFQNYFGGFITRKGTLAGLAYKHEPAENTANWRTFFFLPVNGNSTFIKNLNDNKIKIIDIDSIEGNYKRKRKQVVNQK